MNGQKTYIIGLLGIISAVAGYFSGTLDTAQAGQVLLTSLAAMGLRHGMK